MSDKVNGIIGIGEHRVLGYQIHSSVCEITRSVRERISSGMQSKPVFDYKFKHPDDVKNEFENPDAYRYSHPLSNDDEILACLRHRFEYLESIYTNRHCKFLIETFGSQDEAIDFCFKFIKNEMQMINNLIPFSENDVEVQLESLQAKRQQLVSEECRKHEEERKHREHIERLVRSNNMVALGKLEGVNILQRRLSHSYGLQSNFPWTDFRSLYNISQKQLMEIRSSEGYHKALSDRCIKDVDTYRDQYYRDADNNREFKTFKMV